MKESVASSVGGKVKDLKSQEEQQLSRAPGSSQRLKGQSQHGSVLGPLCIYYYSVCILWLLTWCFGGTPDSVSAVSLILLLLGPFSSHWVALPWWGPGFIAFCCIVFVWLYPWEACYFLGGDWEGASEGEECWRGTERSGVVVVGEAVIGMDCMREKEFFFFLNLGSWMWCTSLIPALWRQRQAGFYEFQARLVYVVSSRPARAT